MLEYEHGGDIVKFANEIGCKESEVLDFSSNINFIKPEIEFDFNSLDISSYPNYEKLYEKVAKLYDVSVDNLELFNGASSGIYALLQNIKSRHCYIYSPAYLEYKKAVNSLHYTVETINRFTDLDIYIEPHSVVVFVNPSTPEGSFYNLEALMEKWISKQCTIIIDESFLDFTSYESVKKFLDSYDELYIIKSMTKFYSSAGIRVGAVIGSERNIARLKQSQPIWKISVFDMHYILHILEDENFSKISKAVNVANKEQLITILESCKHIEHVFASCANFVMVKLKNIDAKEFQKLLKDSKVLIRDCANFDYLDSSFVRFAVKEQKLLEKLEFAIQKINRL